MTFEELEKATSCDVCKALVIDADEHVAWHKEISERIRAAAQTADPRLWSNR